MVDVSKRKPATLDDLLAIPEGERWHELIDGEIVPKSAASGEHADAQGGLIAAFRPAYHRRSGGRGGPGGWWLAIDPDILLPTRDVVRPDVAGWRRDRTPERPMGMPVRAVPDWACEVVSPSNAQRDRVTKMRLYHRVKIEHYWIVDPIEETLSVYRWSEAGYVHRLGAARGETVRAEPFDAVELVVGTLFGDDPPEPAEP